MGKFIHFMHWVNIALQAIFSLLFPVALAVGGSYLLVTYLGVRFILIASRSVEALEAAEKQKQKNLKR